jgi:hypothetical protein
MPAENAEYIFGETKPPIETGKRVSVTLDPNFRCLRR